MSRSGGDSGTKRVCECMLVLYAGCACRCPHLLPFRLWIA